MPGVRDKYRAATTAHLIDQRERLTALALDESLTDRTRQLAAMEASYMDDLMVFRKLSERRRQGLQRRGVAPWFGNWSRYTGPEK